MRLKGTVKAVREQFPEKPQVPALPPSGFEIGIVIAMSPL